MRRCDWHGGCLSRVTQEEVSVNMYYRSETAWVAAADEEGEHPPVEHRGPPQGLEAVEEQPPVFDDPASQDLLTLVRRVAQTDVTTLITGPTGAGKEVVAKTLHEASWRCKGPFVAVNCAALPEQMIESELFGHEKGAFTGAIRAHRGVFEQAHGGTLFLDEIGDMPVHLQVKLLRALQERKIVRLGGEAPVFVNVRVVCATNKDLRLAMVHREFREDLYYRLTSFCLHVPPLAQRPGDIIGLAMRALQRQDPHKRWRLSGMAQAQLLSYGWPGNVRELENVMRRVSVLCSDGWVDESHLLFDETLTAHPSRVVGCLSERMEPVHTTLAQRALQAEERTEAPVAREPGLCSLQTATRQNEYQIIMAAISATTNRVEAARRLGISPRTLRYKLAHLREQGMGSTSVV